MITKVPTRKTRKIVLDTESLERRDLFAVSPLKVTGSSEIHALLKSVIELAPRENSRSVINGPEQALPGHLVHRTDEIASHHERLRHQLITPASPSPTHAALALTRGSTTSASPACKTAAHRSSYDIVIRFSYVGSPGNASIAINGFVPPSPATVPAKSPAAGGTYQSIGGVPYVYGIGQTEITAGQYVTFLNKVDPTGANPVQPFTGIRLWTNAFSPVLNPFSGEINLVQNTKPGTHYQLAASYWANKPLVNGNMFDFAYFVNSMVNGSTIAIDNSQAKSPLGFKVALQTRYVKLSTNISTGMYDLQDSSYPFFQRLDNTGYVIPSENEWIKSAYYSPLSTGNGTHYYYYPTVSNTPPTPLTTASPTPTVDSLGNVIQSNLIPGVAYSAYNQTIVWQPPYDPLPNTDGANVISVGKDHTPSPWLTYDQGGNAVEYTDTTAAPVAGVLNPHDLPVFVKVHGGIANATTYQLWLTATGTSDPYGQSLGQTDTQGGARFGYVPNAAKDQSIGTSKGVSSSALASPLKSARVVYRLDNLNTLNTLYTTSLTTAITLANDPSTYVFMGASFQQPTRATAKPVYGFLNMTTRTQFYTIDPSVAATTSTNPIYLSEGVVFHALSPNTGSTNYREFHNAQTGAYAYSAATADIQFFTSRGYTFDGYAWSTN